MVLTTLKILLFNILLAVFSLVPQKTLSVGLIENPNSFLPHQVQSDSERIVSDLVFRKLFRYEGEELVPDLVEDWSVSEDQKSYNIKLKEEIYWQDGDPITSDDILYSLTLQKDLRDQVNLEKISPKEVNITLPAPSGILPSLLTFGLEPSHLRSQSKIQPTGSTSYRIARSIKERDQIEGVVLQSFKKDKLYPKIIFHFYQNENQLKDAYKLGEINAFLSDTEFDWEGINAQKVSYLGRYYALIFNTSSDKLTDSELRKKLVDSLNIDELLQNNFYINSLKAQGPISMSLYTREVFKQNQYDPNVKLTPAEQTLLADIQVVLPNNKDGQQIESFLRNYWEKNLGIKMLVEFEDPTDLVNKGKGGEFDTILLGHETKPDPDRYAFWHSTQIKDGLNFGKFEDLRADKALEEGRNNYEFVDREKHYNIFQDVMSTKAPAAFLYHPGKFLYTKKGFEIPLPEVIYYPSDIFRNL